LQEVDFNRRRTGEPCRKVHIAVNLFQSKLSAFFIERIRISSKESTGKIHLCCRYHATLRPP
jgi:hypothetical protein